MAKFNTLGMIVASLVLLFSFIRIIRENDGASSELYYWIARAAIFMFLFAIRRGLPRPYRFRDDCASPASPFMYRFRNPG
jgi:hypothetical protein